MPPHIAAMAAEAAANDRQTRILDAAERVFARSGFHVATMNDVASEVGMSPGNLYRYFASKDAIVEALIERDRKMIAEDFGQLDPARGHVLDLLEDLARRRLAGEPRQKAMMALQIWAETARDSSLAHLSGNVDAAVLTGMQTVISAAKAAGQLAPDLDDERFIQAVFMLADGFLCRRGVDPSFDEQDAVETFCIAIRGLARVMVRPSNPTATEATP